MPHTFKPSKLLQLMKPLAIFTNIDKCQKAIPAHTCGVENKPKNIQFGPEMKEIWSNYYMGNIPIHKNGTTILGHFQFGYSLSPIVVLALEAATFKSQTMVIHRRTLGNVPGKWPNRRIAQTFLVISPLHGDIVDLPYINVEDDFFLPCASPPEVFDTLMCVAGYKILVTGYFNRRSFPNPNLQRNFPLIPWKGEIAVLFIGKCKPYVSRAPPRSLLHFAIALYMRICITYVEAGHPFPSHIESDNLAEE
ncbi:hypothetical protein EI94DRAFT_1698088 [Lactarius quietus]|nr:hypothetical protein EI94DRAFT_1698088 [Lactarius quietus]